MTPNHLGWRGRDFRPFPLIVFPEQDWKRPLGPERSFLRLGLCVSQEKVPLPSEGASCSGLGEGAAGPTPRRGVSTAAAQAPRRGPSRLPGNSRARGSRRLLPFPRLLCRHRPPPPPAPVPSEVWLLTPQYFWGGRLGPSVETQRPRLCLLRLGDLECHSSVCTRFAEGPREQLGWVRRVNARWLRFSVLPTPAAPRSFPSWSVSHGAGGRNRFQSPLGHIRCAPEPAPPPPLLHAPASGQSWVSPSCEQGWSVHPQHVGENAFSSCGGAPRGRGTLRRDSEAWGGPGKGPTHLCLPRAHPRAPRRDRPRPVLAFRSPHSTCGEPSPARKRWRLVTCPAECCAGWGRGAPSPRVPLRWERSALFSAWHVPACPALLDWTAPSRDPASRRHRLPTLCLSSPPTRVDVSHSCIFMFPSKLVCRDTEIARICATCHSRYSAGVSGRHFPRAVEAGPGAAARAFHRGLRNF